MKKTGSLVRNKLLEYLEVRDIYELANIDEMSEELQNRLKEGKVIYLDNNYFGMSANLKVIEGLDMLSDIVHGSGE